MHASAYARHRGCTRQAVHAAIKDGRLRRSVLEDVDGRLVLDVNEADHEWFERTDPDQSWRASSSWRRR